MKLRLHFVSSGFHVRLPSGLPGMRRVPASLAQPSRLSLPDALCNRAGRYALTLQSTVKVSNFIIAPDISNILATAPSRAGDQLRPGLDNRAGMGYTFNR